MARSKASISVNLNAFLDSLGWSEGTSTSTVTCDDGYDVIVSGVTGKEIFKDYQTHPFAAGRPAKVVNSKGLKSTASGRYQELLGNWTHYQALLQLKDFGPVSQDLIAIQQLRETPALKLIEQGKITEAVAACRHLWASLPGAGYGQQERTIADFIQVYLKQGGKLWSISTDLSAPLSPLPQPISVVEPLEAIKPQPQPVPVEQPTMQTGLWNLLMNLLKRK